MEEHLVGLREEVASKQLLLNEREQAREAEFSSWTELQSIKLQETREELFELKRQLNAALVAYNEVRAADRARPFGQRHLSAEKLKMFTEKLLVPLNRDEVATRQAGRGGDVVYLETHKAIEKAREIFGLSDLSIEVKSEPQVLFQSSSNGKSSVCMKAVIRVTLANGCFHEDVGVSASNVGDPIEAVKIASKACVSDGIKRALQHLGPALGSCLRDKDFVSHDLMTQQNHSASKRAKPDPTPVQRPQFNPSQQQHRPVSYPPQHLSLPTPPPYPQHYLPPQRQQQQHAPSPPPLQYVPITPEVREPQQKWVEDAPPPLSAASHGTPYSVSSSSSSALNDLDYAAGMMLQEQASSNHKV
ncbi:hypothetical protein BASA81_010373 [Batrachochytrium salamandrivorans]|nr:hypothetical protein BASA81_010373 [Batrachochytrium salamandrivorans]